MLLAAKRNPAAADYTALRLAYARSPEYNPFLGVLRRSSSLAPLMQARDDRAALTRANALLDEYWLDVAVHLFAADAATRLGEAEQATMHRTVGAGLVRSIRSSGDGTSPATAYTVIATGEEYLLVLLANQHVRAQALIEVNGHKYDRLTTTDAAGTVRQVYFNVDLLFAAYPRLLNLPQSQPQGRAGT
ncbi:DUF4919 domain-containing protein [Roseomonas sp. E05]|uniref:DUF4919 domain-containing protein n=1 Tax=Roseomonas sp. E05 TaxID=3046310 RepID=UPI0024BBCE4A|nr:DUF4919 domain-containing protein [Roseomonas sp. E05]MDJ0387805.1 DUF4919 domain-containing protein [Roseomonas sp. E05]